MIFSKKKGTVIMTREEFQGMPDLGLLIPVDLEIGIRWKSDFTPKIGTIHGMTPTKPPIWYLGEYVAGNPGIKIRWSKIVVASIPSEPA